MSMKYEGLWYQSKGYYSSKRFKTASLLEGLPKNTRLIVRFNKAYGSNENNNRPKFQFIFDSRLPDELYADEIEEEEEPEEETMVRLSTAIEAVRNAAYYTSYGYYYEDAAIDEECKLRELSHKAIIVDDD